MSYKMYYENTCTILMLALTVSDFAYNAFDFFFLGGGGRRRKKGQISTVKVIVKTQQNEKKTLWFISASSFGKHGCAAMSRASYLFFVSE